MNRNHRRFFSTVASLCLLVFAAFAVRGAQAATTETIVVFRHGEKPEKGLGQLTCRGLNRALALPSVLLSKFGKPDYLFAPDPAVQVHDGLFGVYSYVRPLATIEPTAIRLGMPVNAQIGYPQIDRLQAELTSGKYSSSTVFVAWEHYYEERFARNIVQSFGGDPSQVPSWSNSEYDMIYVIRITRSEGRASVSFAVDHEGLDGKLSDDCPTH
ncbi:MAG: hypothetical protein P4L03_04705 [Terracidiphilus sp.]|nr:hypothetical protein [Terracidiphilus sp.]